MIDISTQQLKRALAIKLKIEKLERQVSEILGTSSSASVADGRRKKRTMSASARAKIAAAQRKRWAKVKAGKK